MYTQDLIRYLRCLVVIGEVLTEIMQKYLEQCSVPPEELYNVIMSNGCAQFRKKLYPEQMQVVQTLKTDGFKKLDIPLLYLIVRHRYFKLLITDAPTHGWGNYPQHEDNTVGDNIERIRRFRNEIKHKMPWSMSKAEFGKHFSTLVDIGRRADLYFSNTQEEFKTRIKEWEECKFNDEMAQETMRDNPGPERIFEINLEPGISLDVFFDQEKNGSIKNLRSQALTKDNLEVTLIIKGVENPEEMVKILNSRIDELKTKMIKLLLAECGSIELYLEVESALFRTDELMRKEFEDYIKNLIKVTDLKFATSEKSYVVLVAASGFSDDTSDESDKEYNSDEDLILHLKAQKEAFQTNQISQKSIGDFVKQLVTNTNGHPLKSTQRKNRSVKKTKEKRMVHNKREVSQWLQDIELNALYPKFENEDISVFGLVEMDRNDLTEIGVTKIGHISRILKKAKDLKSTLEITVDCMPTEVKEVSQVLSFIGLAHYIEQFRREEIEIKALCEISENDLKEMKVNKKGPRVLILAAGRKLKHTFGLTESECKDMKHILNESGLSHLVEKFETEEITNKVLTVMRSKEFEEIGIKKIGHIILLKAAAKRVISTEGQITKIGETMESIIDDFGLHSFVKTFAEEDITLDTLIEMDDDDLKEIGVNKKGQRILLMSLAMNIRQIKAKEDKPFNMPEDLNQFLEMIGLQHLNKKFESEGILIKVIPHVDEKDLVEIGVGKKGARVRILTAAKKIEVDWTFVNNVETIEDLLCSLELQYLTERFIDEAISIEDIIDMSKSDLEGIGKIGEIILLTSAARRLKKRPAKLFEKKESNADKDILARQPKSKSTPVQEVLLHDNTKQLKQAKAPAPILEQSVYSTKSSISNLMSRVTTINSKSQKILQEIYTDVIDLFKQGKLYEMLENEIINSYGDPVKIMKEAKEDLISDICPIVVTGETSAGKSTFVNLLLGVELMPRSQMACTSIICAIHSSTDKKATLTRVQDGKDIKETLMINKDIEANALKDLLKKYICLQTKSKGNEQKDDIKQIDIWWPIPCIPTTEKNIVIVDTPGIGPDYPELTERLFEYLPKALAFIYILNTPNAGGVQKDRLLRIQEELVAASVKKQLIFKAENAIFICNKWDQLVDEEDPDGTFQTIQQILIDKWSGFETDKLFRLSAKEEFEAMRNMKNMSSEFRKVADSIEKMIPLTIEEKSRKHLEWLQQFVEHIKKRITGTKKASSKNRKELQQLVSKYKDRISKVEENARMKKSKITHTYTNDVTNMMKKIVKELKNVKISWTEDKLPELNKMEKIEERVEQLAREKVQAEIKKLYEIKIVEFNENLENSFQSEMFKIKKEVEDTEQITSWEDENEIPWKMEARKKRKNFLKDVKKSCSKQKAAIAFTSPLWVPPALVAAIIVLPFGIGYHVKNYVSVTQYRENKIKYIEGKTKEIIQFVDEEFLMKECGNALLERVKEKVNTFFEKTIPNRIKAGKKYLIDLQTNLKDPQKTYQQCRETEKVILPIFGRILFSYYHIFEDSEIDPKKIVRCVTLQPQHSDGTIVHINANTDSKEAVEKESVWCNNGKSGYIELAEIRELRNIIHENIACVYGTSVRRIQGKLQGYVYMESCESNLDKEVFEISAEWNTCEKYLTDSLSGLAYLHGLDIVHQNIKLANILITYKEAKISDGGLSRLPELKGEIIGIPIIRAPEVLKNSERRFESDIFQFGIVIWEVWNKKRAFCSDENCIKETYEELISSIIGGEHPEFKPEEKENDICKKILQCFNFEPEGRPSINEIRYTLTYRGKDAPIHSSV